MRQVLFCSSNLRDSNAAMNRAREDGLRINSARQSAVLESLGIEIIFRHFRDRVPEDVEKIRGLELAGVVGLWTVGERARDHIMASLRP